MNLGSEPTERSEEASEGEKRRASEEMPILQRR